ncbi:hypothetical protein ACHWQZ_G014064 [Mnemiopsis leidyi]
MNSFGTKLGNLDFSCERTRFALTFLCIISLACVINLCVLVVFTWKRKYQKSYHQAYMNLAVSDTALALFGLLFRSRSFGCRVSYDSKAVCESGVYLASLLPAANFLSVLPITTDRLAAIFRPIRYKSSNHRRRQSILILLCWFTPFSVSVIIVIYQKITHIGSVADFAAGQVCQTAHWLENSVFHHFPTTICGFGTLVVNVVSYSAMTWILHRRQRIGAKSKSLLIRSVIMVVTFSLSWLPAFVLIDVIKRNGTCLIKWTAQVLLYLNTLTDPLIYVLTPKIIKLYLYFRVQKLEKRKIGRQHKAGCKVRLYQDSKRSIDTSPRRGFIQLEGAPKFLSTASKQLISEVTFSDPMKLIESAVVKTAELMKTSGRPKAASMSIMTAVNTTETIRKLLHTGPPEKRASALTNNPEKALESLGSKRTTQITEYWQRKIVDFFASST